MVAGGGSLLLVGSLFCWAGLDPIPCVGVSSGNPLPYMGYTGICGPKGYEFSAVLDF